jgi:hypothetical protein
MSANLRMPNVHERQVARSSAYLGLGAVVGGDQRQRQGDAKPAAGISEQVKTGAVGQLQVRDHRCWLIEGRQRLPCGAHRAGLHDGPTARCQDGRQQVQHSRFVVHDDDEGLDRPGTAMSMSADVSHVRIPTT